MTTRNSCFMLLMGDTEQRSVWWNDTGCPIGTTQQRIWWQRSQQNGGKTLTGRVSTLMEMVCWGRLAEYFIPTQVTVYRQFGSRSTKASPKQPGFRSSLLLEYPSSDSPTLYVYVRLSEVPPFFSNFNQTTTVRLVSHVRSPVFQTQYNRIQHIIRKPLSSEFEAQSKFDNRARIE